MEQLNRHNKITKLDDKLTKHDNINRYKNKIDYYCFERYFKTLEKTNRYPKSICFDRILIMLYCITVQLKNKELFDKVYLFAKSYNNYENKAKPFIIMANYLEQHNFILSSMISKTFDIEKFNNLKKDKPLKIFDINIYNDFHQASNLFIENSITSSELAIKLINESNIQYKNIKTYFMQRIINEVKDKINISNKFNKPELIIFNFLIQLANSNHNILYVCSHFTIPIKRIKSLNADFIVIINYNNTVKFAIIEYDGPSHYNPKCHLFNNNHVICDTIKNKYCIDNQINLLRVFDYQHDYITRIETFIQQTIKGNIIYDIPNEIHYKNLITAGCKTNN